MKSLSCVRLFATLWTVAPPGSSVHGVFQTRILEWVAISFSREFSWPQGLNSGLPHFRQTLYHLSHQGILNIWLIAYIPTNLMCYFCNSKHGNISWSILLLCTKKIIPLIFPKVSKILIDKLSWGSLVVQLVKNPFAMEENLVWFLGREVLLEKG